MTWLYAFQTFGKKPFCKQIFPMKILFLQENLIKGILCKKIFFAVFQTFFLHKYSLTYGFLATLNNGVRIKILGNNLKWLGTQKLSYFCRVSPISTRHFCNITRTFKRTSLRLFRYQISQFVPFSNKIRKIYRKYAKRGQIVKF